MNLPATIPVTARLPQTYESARLALSRCYQIDEVQDWADKAAALASYAKQAEDDELERMATRIRARAIRRAGELLKSIAPSKGGQPTRGGDPTSRNGAAKSAGLSRDQKVTALRVASVPDDEFEDAVESEKPPTVTALAERGKRKKRPALPKNPAPIAKESMPVGTLLSDLGNAIADTLAHWPDDESLAPAIRLLEEQTKYFKSMSRLRRMG